MAGPGSMHGNEILYEVRHEIYRGWMIYAIALHSSQSFLSYEFEYQNKKECKNLIFFLPQFPRIDWVLRTESF